MKIILEKKANWMCQLRLILFLSIMGLVGCSFAQNDSSQTSQILKNIKIPEFKDQTYNILEFGAINDGLTLSTLAINKAIETCHENGGGTVLIPEGTFYTGAIHLLSNVNLHVTEGAVLSFSTQPKEYLPLVYTRWEGIDCYNYSPLIYAQNQTNIAITGIGKLQGNASSENWWIWKGKPEEGWTEAHPSQLMQHARPALDQYNANEVPVENRRMGEGFYLRPQFINFVKCANVLIEDVTIENSPFWVIHPLFCENVVVRGIHINSLGPNNDGCDPESCKNVLIENCYFNTGDDCIAIKSGRNKDGLKANIPSENIIVRNCSMENGHGGVVMGSEISGGVRNVFIENCTMDSPDLDRAIRIKTNSNRGGMVENIYINNIKVGEVSEAVLKINCLYDIKKEGTDTLYPVIRNIYLSDIECRSSKYGVFLMGIENQNSIYNIHISKSSFNGVKKGNNISNASNVTFEKVYINNELVVAE